jgi:hypothetical protein
MRSSNLLASCIISLLVLIVSVLQIACGGAAATSTSTRDAGSADATRDTSSDGSSRAEGGSSGQHCSPIASLTADLFVAPNGQDDYSGTLSAPNSAHTDGPTTLKAIESKIQGLQKGRTTPIVVFLEDGTYNLARELGGPWSLTTSGTTAAPIVFAAAPGATPVISGGVAVTGWSKTTIHGVAAWIASAANLQPFEQLWVDGVRRYRPTTTPNGYLYNDNSTNSFTTMTYQGKDIDPNWYDLAHVEIDDFEQWTMARMRINGVDSATSLVTMTGSTETEDATAHGFLPHHRYLAENVKEALTQPGQWYLDQLASPSMLYYIPMTASEDPLTESIVAPQVSKLFSATDISNVILKGITFSYSNWTVPPQGWQDSQTESAANADLPAAVTFDGTNSVKVDACVFSHLSGVGVEFEGYVEGQTFPNATADCKTTFVNQLVNSEITDTGGSGLRIGTWATATTSNNDANVPQCDLVQNNVVSGVGRFLVSGNGIFIGSAHHVTVRNNDVFDTYTYAVDVGATYGMGVAHDHTIEFNHVYEVGQGVTSDIAAVYTATGSTGVDNVVQNNVVHDITHDPGNSAAGAAEGYGGWGLYNDHGSSNVTWQNNIAYRCSDACMQFNFGTGGIIRNNIFAFGSEAGFHFGQVQMEPERSFTFENNIVYWDSSAASGDVWQSGNWTCGLSPAPTACYSMKDNLYVDVGGMPAFDASISQLKLTGRISKGEFSPFTYGSWRMKGEDPPPSSDAFSLSFGTAASPTFTTPTDLPIPFVPIDPAMAGRSCALLEPPAIPPGFPLQAWPGKF